MGKNGLGLDNIQRTGSRIESFNCKEAWQFHDSKSRCISGSTRHNVSRSVVLGNNRSCVGSGPSWLSTAELTITIGVCRDCNSFLPFSSTCGCCYPSLEGVTGGTVNGTFTFIEHSRGLVGDPSISLGSIDLEAYVRITPLPVQWDLKDISCSVFVTSLASTFRVSIGPKENVIIVNSTTVIVNVVVSFTGVVVIANRGKGPRCTTCWVGVCGGVFLNVLMKHSVGGDAVEDTIVVDVGVDKGEGTIRRDDR
mmetsp:Transcript_15801/g.22279  ORF Transcript_15801/g.22279 Transcript_15801/m.22279 type:complete len:252 (+) Transcript_15801:930-1685(+)